MLEICFQKRVLASVMIIMLVSVIFMSFGVASYADGGYETKSYDVNITVGEDNVLDVTEIIKVDFPYPKHGIYRNIPYKGDMLTRYQGKDYKSYGVMKIKDVDVKGYDFEVENSSETFIKIGDPDKTVTGEHTYVINYKAVIYEDKFKNYDFLYWNVLPTKWESTIEKSSINIIMPKGVNRDDIKFFSGKYGEKNTDINFKTENMADGRMIIKASASKLGMGEGITVYSSLPQGYFKNAATFDSYNIAVTVFSIIIFLLVALLWFAFGRDPKLIKTPEFYPPENMNPLQIGYIIDKAVGNQEMVALLIYMANKGYLNIKEIKDEKGKTDDFILIATGQVPVDEEDYVASLYQAVFSRGNEVSYGSLGIDFWEDFEEIKQSATITAIRENAKFYTTKSRLARLACIVFQLISIAFFGCVTCIMSPLGMRAVWAGAPFAVLLIAHTIFSYILLDKKDYYSKGKYIAGNVLNAVLGIGSVGAAMLTTYFGLQSFKSGLIVGICQLLIVFFGKYAKSYSREGVRLYGRILGFRDYIKTAELKKLQMLVDEDPAYFYNILPYAYVLGLSDKWINNFKTISVPDPYWGDGMNGMYMASWLVYANSITTSGINDYNSSLVDSDSSGSFLSGGGFSGGGFGGGGGGSW